MKWYFVCLNIQIYMSDVYDLGHPFCDFLIENVGFLLN